MGSVYQKASKDVYDKAADLLVRHYAEVHASKLTIDFVFAYAATNDKGQPTGPAIMHQGYPALGLCRVLSLKDRAMGRADVEITIDGDQWPEMSPEQQDALLDHELHHIQLRLNKVGKLDTDDLGRPKVSIRKHDRQYGWFDAIAKRHGAASFEVQQANNLLLAAKSIYFEQGEFAFEQPLAKLAECVDGKDISSIEISAGGSSVTIDHQAAKLLKRAAAEMRGAN